MSNQTSNEQGPDGFTLDGLIAMAERSGIIGASEVPAVLGALRELRDRRAAETDDDPSLDPANAEIIARLKAAFGEDGPDLKILASAMCKLADGALAPNGVALLTKRECKEVGKELRRMNREARSQVKASDD